MKALAAKQKQRLRTLLFVCAVLLPGVSVAETIPPAIAKRWLEINYYQPSGNGHESEITNADYFLAPEGRTSPEHEYEAFLKALREGDRDKVCAFPARATLVLPFVPEATRPECPAYLKESNPAQVRSVSLVFASGYFENPASYFGHTMLKLNGDSDEHNRYLFGTSLNYGAKVTDPMGPIYAIKGLTGAYTASYSKGNETIDTYGYTNNQMRDVWEYELNLTDAQRLFIIEHAWELRRAQFRYYFLNDNCANRIALVVEMATGETLSKTHGQWTMPVQITQNLTPGLVENEARKASLKSQTQNGYLKLSAEDKRGFMAYHVAKPEDRPVILKGLGYPALVVLLGHLDVGLAKEKGQATPDSAVLMRQRQAVLIELFKRTPEPQPATAAGPESKPSPATLRRPGALQLSYIVRPGDNAARLRYQAANNDLFTTPYEGQEVSRFIMGALELEATTKDAYVNKLTFLDIASFNTNPLPMRVSGDYSWSLRMEYAPRSNICRKCSAVTVDGKLGLSERFGPDLMLYTLLGPQLNHRKTAFNDYLMLASESGLLLTITPKAKFGAEAIFDISPLHGDPNMLVRGTFAYDLAPQSDLRFSLEQDGHGTAATAGLAYYF